MVGMGVSAWWRGQPQVGEWGIRRDGEARCVCGWSLSSESLGGTPGCGRARIQGPHVEHTVPSPLLAPHHWGSQALV